MEFIKICLEFYKNIYDGMLTHRGFMSTRGTSLVNCLALDNWVLLTRVMLAKRILHVLAEKKTLVSVLSHMTSVGIQCCTGSFLSSKISLSFQPVGRNSSLVSQDKAWIHCNSIGWGISLLILMLSASSFLVTYMIFAMFLLLYLD